MPKRATSPKSKLPQAASVTPVRKTVAPRKSAKLVATAATIAAPVLTHERIAERAYFISRSGNGGSESDNWFRAQSELEAESRV